MTFKGEDELIMLTLRMTAVLVKLAKDGSK